MYSRQYSSDLSTTFSTSEADLEANRKGYLTIWQLDNLPFASTDETSREHVGSAVRTAVTTVAGVIVAFAFFAFLMGHGEELTNLVPVTLRPLVVGLIVVAVIGAMLWLSYAAVSQNRASRDWESARIATMRVDATSGRVQPIADRSDGEQRHYLEVNGHRLYTSKHELKAFKPGKQYRLYYVTGPDGSYLVNAEDLSG
jgi:hypothetical protein